jgi:hypothetical protein
MHNNDPNSIMVSHLDAPVPNAYLAELNRTFAEFLEHFQAMMISRDAARRFRLVFIDEIESEFDEHERVEYFKRFTRERERIANTQEPLRPRVCRRPPHSSRQARDAAIGGHARRNRGTRPTRVRL